jgi:uncharacterized repeat protein (TIGR03847 family)
MAIEDLGPAERFVAGAIGEPGSRIFFLQVTAGGATHSLVAEKEQIAALATQGISVLDTNDINADPEAVDRIVEAGMDLADPGPEGGRFRVGEISLGMAESELLTVIIESTEDDDGVQFVIAPEQFMAMATVALQVVAAGRPSCPWCSLPMDPDGHACPARNGHNR